MAVDAGLDQYGYHCSLCCYLDTFNEKMLLECPPVDIIQIKLQEHISQGRIATHNLHGEMHRTAVELTLPCTRRVQHRPIPCENTSPEYCFRPYHWRICQGFYRITILVSFQIKDSNNSDVVRVQFAFINRILSCVKPFKTIEAFQPAGGTAVISTPDSGGTRDIVNTPTSRCRALMDMLFCYTCSYSKFDFFHYNLTQEEKVKILEEKIIMKQQVELKTEEGTKTNSPLNGVILECSRPQDSESGSNLSHILIPVTHVCNLLYSKRRVNTPKLYFCSYDIRRGEFGVKTIFITLVLISKLTPGVTEFCERNLELLNIRSNPFLQLSPSLKVGRLCQVHDESIKLQIRLIMCENLLVQQTPV